MEQEEIVETWENKKGTLTSLAHISLIRSLKERTLSILTLRPGEYRRKTDHLGRPITYGVDLPVVIVSGKTRERVEKGINKRRERMEKRANKIRR